MKVRFFTKKTCPTCKVAKELLERFIHERKLSALVSVEHHDLDTVDGLAEGAYWDVMAVPTLIVERGRKVVARWDGQVPREADLERALS